MNKKLIAKLVKDMLNKYKQVKSIKEENGMIIIEVME